MSVEKGSTLQHALDNSDIEQTRKALQKNRRINLRVSQAEHSSIASAAENEKMTISEYILALHYQHSAAKKIAAAAPQVQHEKNVLKFSANQ